jgi:hypothetical protein
MVPMKIPPLLRTIGRKWRALAVKLGHFNGLVLLTVLYWIVIGIVSGFFALLRQDPLGRRTRRGTNFHPKGLAARSVAEYEHLY